MKKKKRRSTVFRVCIPLIVFFLMQYLGTILAEAYIMVNNAGMILEESGLNEMTSVTYEELTQCLMPVLMKLAEAYEVEIYGFAALCTIPVSWLFIRGDRKAREESEKMAPKIQVEPGFYAYLPVLGAAVCIAANCLAVMTSLVSADQAYQTTSESLYQAAFPVQILCLGLVLPIAEELLYRGLVYRRLRERSGFYFSILTVAVLFALAHDNLVQMLYTIGLGILLCYSYEKYASLKAPVLLHTAANLLSLIFTQFAVWDWMTADFMRMGIAVILSAFVGSTAFVGIQRIRTIDKNPTELSNSTSSDSTGI